jgi:hypothetical protein
MNTALKKSLSDVGRLAELLFQLNLLNSTFNYEAVDDANGTNRSARLRSAIGILADILLELTTEETAELIANKSAVAALRSDAEVRKIGRDNAQRIIAPVDAKLSELGKAVDRILAMPMPGGPARFDAGTFIQKEQDGRAGRGRTDLSEQLERLDPDELLDLAIKAAQSRH